MIFPLFRRPKRPDTISVLYGAIVAQARSPVFYRDFGVPDTVDGRFDLLVLHLALVLRRLAGESEPFQVAGQQLFDHFCADMDRNLREIGIGDLKVPEEMRRICEAYYGRAQAYEQAFTAADDDLLARTIARNVYGQSANEPAGARPLGSYVRASLAGLPGQDPVALCRGEVRFPDPAASRTAAELKVG